MRGRVRDMLGQKICPTSYKLYIANSYILCTPAPGRGELQHCLLPGFHVVSTMRRDVGFLIVSPYKKKRLSLIQQSFSQREQETIRPLGHPLRFARRIYFCLVYTFQFNLHWAQQKPMCHFNLDNLMDVQPGAAYH
ncbi:hypothetical protein J6590_031929 [Homalodisca vitripennis]|nr:hypothetical protein J6590_031929 [Homalodisca vitripennis]